MVHVLDNAAKFTPRGSEVAVGVRTAADVDARRMRYQLGHRRQRPRHLAPTAAERSCSRSTRSTARARAATAASGLGPRLRAPRGRGDGRRIDVQSPPEFADRRPALALAPPIVLTRAAAAGPQPESQHPLIYLDHHAATRSVRAAMPPCRPRARAAGRTRPACTAPARGSRALLEAARARRSPPRWARTPTTSCRPRRHRSLQPRRARRWSSLLRRAAHDRDHERHRAPGRGRALDAPQHEHGLQLTRLPVPAGRPSSRASCAPRSPDTR